MRINLNSPVPEGVATEKSDKTVGAARHIAGSSQVSEGTHSEDTVRLTGLASHAMSMPAVRQDLVAQLRQAIQNGQYSVDPQKIADAMLQLAAQ